MNEGDTLFLDGIDRGEDLPTEHLTMQPVTPEAVVIGVGIYLKPISSL